STPASTPAYVARGAIPVSTPWRQATPRPRWVRCAPARLGEVCQVTPVSGRIRRGDVRFVDAQEPLAGLGVGLRITEHLLGEPPDLDLAHRARGELGAPPHAEGRHARAHPDADHRHDP